MHIPSFLGRLWPAAISFCFISLTGATAAELIPLDTPWKKTVYEFAAKHLQHSAWGLAHSKRDYLLSLDIAEHAPLAVDREALFAAAFLHDMGGFDEFKLKGVDHAVRSAQLVEGVLAPTGFPMEKLPKVKEAILAHTYYNPVAPRTPEEIALHDADVLDFLGAISIARIVSLTERDRVAPTLLGAVKVLEQLCHDLPDRLFTSYSAGLGKARAVEMRSTLEAMREESYGGEAL